MVIVLCSPECASPGELTMKSDVYSFGVILFELISGRHAIVPNRPANEQNLVTWILLSHGGSGHFGSPLYPRGNVLYLLTSLLPQDGWSLPDDDNWYWLGVGVLLLYTVFFNLIVTLALSYLNPIKKSQTIIPIDVENNNSTNGTG